VKVIVEALGQGGGGKLDQQLLISAVGLNHSPLGSGVKHQSQERKHHRQYAGGRGCR